MKKIFCFFMSSVFFVLSLFLTSCAGGWEEIQSITYTTESETKTLTSTYVFDYKIEKIVKEEYNPNLQNQITVSPQGIIPKNRKDFIDKLKNNKNKIEHFHYYQNNNGIIADGPIDESYYEVFEKKSFFDYKLEYVKIKFFNDNTIGLNYYQDDNIFTIRILPTSYTITYFND